MDITALETLTLLIQNVQQELVLEFLCPPLDSLELTLVTALIVQVKVPQAQMVGKHILLLDSVFNKLYRLLNLNPQNKLDNFTL